MTGPAPQRRDDRPARHARIHAHVASYHAPTLAAAAYTLAAAATLPAPLAAAAVAAPLTIDTLTGRRLRRHPENARVRARWTRAIIKAGAANPPPQNSMAHDDPIGPRPRHIERVPAGHRIHLTSQNGYRDLENVLHKIEARLDCPVRLDVDPQHPSRAIATLIERDPLQNHPPVPWPLRDHTHTTVWDPLPLGIDDDHQPIGVGSMGTGHVLVAGITGSGKTVVMNLFIAQAILDPDCTVTIIDGAGGVDYIPWATTSTLIDDDVTKAADALERVRDHIKTIGATLIRDDQARVTAGNPTHRIILDEAGFYFNHPDTDEAKRFRAAYQDLIQRGRKFGLQFILGMQRPSATSISTDVRSQFGYRIGLRTADRETTRMIFPEDGAPAPHDLPAHGYVGVGYAKPEGDRFTRFKGYMLDRDEQRRIAERAHGRDLDDDPNDPRTSDLIDRKADIILPSAEGHGGYPRDLLAMTEDDLRALLSPAPHTPHPGDAPADPGTPTPAPADAGTPPDTAPAGTGPREDPVLAALLQVLLDAGPEPVRRTYLNQRLMRSAKGWHERLPDAITAGLVRVDRAKSGPKGGQPAKLYSLTGEGRQALARITEPRAPGT
jgi:hypothetical protein